MPIGLSRRQQLEEAIVTLESQRPSLGDTVTDAAIAALQEQLAEMMPSTSQEQRKLVTVLFADLAGWTAMVESMDPEDAREVQRAYFTAVSAPIVSHGGSVEKYVGDAVMAVFGVPQAHEDDAERAVRAALAMQEELQVLNRRLQEERGLRLAMRIGIDTGVVVSAVDADGDFVVTGDPVNLAARLQELARPGAVFISEDTYRQVDYGFQTDRLEPVVLKGKTDPVVVFRVLKAEPEADKLRNVTGFGSPLVGRTDELQALETAMRRLRAGVGGVITIVGDAGIGKSRLVAEVRRGQTQTSAGELVVPGLATDQEPGPNKVPRPSQAAVDAHADPNASSPASARTGTEALRQSPQPQETVSAGSSGATGASTITWVEGHCSAHGSSTAYQLWLSMLQWLLKTTPDMPASAVSEAAQAWLRELCPVEMDQIYPYLERLLLPPTEPDLNLHQETPPRMTAKLRSPAAGGLTNRGMGTVAAYAQQITGEPLRRATFTAVATLLRCVAQRGPLVLVCEDLHWADPTSIALLEHVLALTLEFPLLFICVYRPDREHPSWRLSQTAARLFPGSPVANGDQPSYTALWLDPLSASASEELVANLLGLVLAPVDAVPDSRPRRLVWRILSRAEGNPFFMEEVIRSLIDNGVLVRDDSSDHWVLARTVDEIRVPDTLQKVLFARIDRLPVASRRLLQQASIIGRSFKVRILDAVAGHPDDLQEQLSLLQRHDIISPLTGAGEPEYTFKHHLLQEAAYGMLLRRERMAYHRRAAEALEQVHASRLEDAAEMLAQHWERAGETGKAVPYLVLAGDRAWRLGASLEAIEFYQRSLREIASGAAIQEAGPSIHRIYERLGDVYLENLSRHDEALTNYQAFMERATTDLERVRGGRKLASIYMLRGDLEMAREHFQQALAQASALPATTEHSRLYSAMAYLLILLGEFDGAAEHARLAESVARAIDDRRGLADSHRIQGILASQQHDPQTALEHARRSLDLYQELGDLQPATAACNNIADSYRQLGQLGQAQRYLDQGLELARRLGNRREEALLLITKGQVLLDQGEWSQAVELLEEALDVAQESGVVPRIIQARLILGAALEAENDLPGAAAHLAEAERMVQATGHQRFQEEVYLRLAHLQASQGDYGQSRGYLEQAMQADTEPGAVASHCLYQRCYAYLYSRQAEWNQAISYLERCVSQLAPSDLPVEQAQARLELGLAYRRRDYPGDQDRACDELTQALQKFQEFEASGYAALAATALRDGQCQ